MEARLLRHVDFGAQPGSANMMICEIVMLHVAERVMTEQGGIDPRLIDQVARLGAQHQPQRKQLMGARKLQTRHRQWRI